MTDEPETTEDTTESSRGWDDELKAIAAILRQLKQLDELEQLPLEDLLAKRYQRLMSYGN